MPQISSPSLFFNKNVSLPLLIIFLLTAVSALAASPLPDIIPLDEISRGMKGYGLTVFEGTAIDTFSVEVIGIQKNNRPGGSMLLVEVAGHGLEFSSIAQGMSGSPIFIEGRFAGALAFGWGGALRPIAGVTPAGEILALPDDLPGKEELSTGAISLSNLLSPYPNGNPLAHELVFDQGVTGSAHDIPAVLTTLTDAWPSAEALAKDMLAIAGAQTGDSTSGVHLLVQAAGRQDLSSTGTSGHTENITLKPGSACGIPLVTGDAQLGATGTVTWVQDDRVFMFGHPFMQRGPVDFPLATAEVLTVFPSRQMSFKMAAMGEMVGSVHHDQRAGIAGRLGKVPAMIPVDVDLLLPAVEGSEPTMLHYKFQVVDDRLLSPTLVFWSLYNSVLAQADDASLQTLNYEIITTWEGGGGVADEPLVLSGVTAGPGSVQALASEWMGPLSILLNNPYHAVKLKTVKARFTLSRPMDMAKIIGLSGPRVAVAPGETVVYKVEIAPRHGKRQFIDFSVKLPATMEPGRYRVVVASAAEIFNLEPLRAPGSFDVASLGGMMDILKTNRARNSLVLGILAPGGNVVLQGREMKHMPQRMTRLLKKGNMEVQPTLADYVLRMESSVPWALQGHALRALELKVDGESLKMERRP